MFFATPVLAETPNNEQGTALFPMGMSIMCGDTEKLFDLLTKQFDEKPLLIADNASVEGDKLSVWVSFETGAMTVVRTTDEYSCILDTGKDTLIRKQKQGISL